MFASVEWGDVTSVASNVVFDDTMKLLAGDLELQLIYVSPAHTNGTAVVWIPLNRREASIWAASAGGPAVNELSQACAAPTANCRERNGAPRSTLPWRFGHFIEFNADQPLRCLA